MPSFKPMMKKIFQRIANRVHQHDLFEQPYERDSQSPIEPPTAANAVDTQETNVDKPSLADPQSNAVTSISAEAFLNWVDTIERPVVINHWATWCEPCQEELPLLAQLQTQLGEVDLVGLSWELFEDGRLPEDTAVSRIQAMSEAHGLSWANLLITDDPDTFFDTLSLSKRLIPQTWVIHPNGVLDRWEHHGVIEADDLPRIIQAVQSA